MEKYFVQHALQHISMKQRSFKARLAQFFLQASHLFHLSALSSGPLAWYLLMLSVLLFLIPYNFTSPLALVSYDALSLVPIGLAVVLRARKGAIVACGLVASGTAFYTIKAFGLSWPGSVVNNWVIGNISLLFLALIVGYIRTLGNQLAIAHRQLTIAHEEIQKQVLTDALTGLPNHRAIVQSLEKEFERAHRYQQAFSLIFFDSDHFKRVNDTYGHAIGDVVLQELGHYGSSALRNSDIMGRFGGEEFVVLLPETDATQATYVAERLRAAVAAQPLATTYLAEGINVTISIGIATYPEDGETIGELLNAADHAMYLAKRLGRNQVCTTTQTKQARYATILETLLTSDEHDERMLDSPSHLNGRDRDFDKITI